MQREFAYQYPLADESPARSPRWRWGVFVGYIFCLGFCVTSAIVFLRSSGSLLAVVALITGAAVVFVSFYRLDWGFYILLLTCLVFGQFEVPGFSTFTFRVSYFRNLKEIYYLPYMSRGDVNPFELHVLLLFTVWVVLACIRRQISLRRISLWFPALMWFTWIVVAFAYGMQNGGERMPALWESRALMYMGLMAFVVPQVIHTKAQIRTFIWVCIAGISVKAFEGIQRYIENGWSTAGYEAMHAHEDPVFIVTLFFLLLGLFVFGGDRAQRRLLLLLSLPLALGFYVGLRRAAYAAMLISFVAYMLLIPPRDLLKGLKYIIPLLLAGALYTAVFWNSGSSLAGPIRQIRSGFTKDDGSGEVVKDRNFYSNLYRRIEDYDLAVTVQNSPVMGIGFGTRYEQPLELAQLDFALRDFMAHNNVIWLLVKVGGIGFFLFWFYLNCVALKGASLVRRLKDPYLKAVSALIVVAIINQMVAAYYDLHLVRYRTMIYLGSLIGLLSSIDAVPDESESGPGDVDQDISTGDSVGYE